ncbi:hypothetical protein [Allomesorhizobium alhagi]|uniref:hypothetical protein n=1 Tax=Allomesorhizobium alhagi TaxID=475067 RepID=UPI001111C377|nr:hypothetical protein [Mesorhizobium alhagi]
MKRIDRNFFDERSFCPSTGYADLQPEFFHALAAVDALAVGRQHGGILGVHLSQCSSVSAVVGLPAVSMSSRADWSVADITDERSSTATKQMI